MKRRKRMIVALMPLIFGGSGCMTQSRQWFALRTPGIKSPKIFDIRNQISQPSIAKINSPTSASDQNSEVKLASLSRADNADPVDTAVAELESFPNEGPSPENDLPAYGQLESLPIDLPTVIRLLDENSPLIGIARTQVRQAQARLANAEAQWLPNLTLGTNYNRFDGQTQNQAGSVFGVSRGNLFAGNGLALSLDMSDAIYRPLIERRLTTAERLRMQSVEINAEVEAISAYLDLLQVYGQVVINAEVLSMAESMLAAASNARDAKLDRTPGDVNRAQIEVYFRRAERVDLEGRIGTLSARLGRLLLLEPNVKLTPVEQEITPISLIRSDCTLDELVSEAINNRPDLAANRVAIAAAWARVQKQEQGPFLPKIAIVNQVGSFGGGLNGDLQDFDARNALSAQIYWELRNLGHGNRADVAERRAIHDQVHLQLVEAQARITAEIVEAAQTSMAKLSTLKLAELAVEEAHELYRINKEGTLNVLDAKNLFDALRPLQAIQLLNQARSAYLSAIIEHNRAQYRLYSALGCPPRNMVEPQL